MNKSLLEVEKEIEGLDNVYLNVCHLNYNPPETNQTLDFMKNYCFRALNKLVT